MELICPICAGALSPVSGACRCPNGHCFDVARQGYVNLLTVQQKHSLQPGDTREQVLARREFLESGTYVPIVTALMDAAQRHGAAGPLLDVGCGEGYYSSRLAEALNLPLLGLDISKEAVRCAAGKYKQHTWVCATASHLPVPDGSIGTVTSLFSLTVPEAFSRCLRPDGLYLQVIAGADHLLGLKSIIYPQLKQKDKCLHPQLPGFSLLESVPIRFSFTVTGSLVQKLLYMTPHLYRISKEGLDRLSHTETLTDTASCMLNIYRKHPGLP